jgi:hypothetical protein
MNKKNWVVAILFFCAVLPLPSQTISLRAGGGIMLPQENSFRKIYGNAFPLVFEARVRFAGNYGVAVGLDWLSKKGKAWPLDQGEEEFAVRFKMISIPFSVFYEYSGKLGRVPLGVALGLGISWHSYEENWETAELSYQGKKWGPLVYATADFRFLSRVGLFTSLRWESVGTGQISPLGEVINLGGIMLLAGVTFYLN